MTAPARTHEPRPWRELALEAPRLASRRELLRRVVLALVTVPGLWLLFGLTVYGLHYQPLVLGVVVFHLAALAACWLPPRALVADPAFQPHPLGRAPVDGPVSRLGRLRRTLADRGGRLALLRQVVTVEVLLTFLWPPLATLLSGARLQWSAWFTLAFAMLLVLRPLELVTRAEAREGKRLLRRTLDPSR